MIASPASAVGSSSRPRPAAAQLALSAVLSDQRQPTDAEDLVIVSYDYRQSDDAEDLVIVPHLVQDLHVHGKVKAKAKAKVKNKGKSNVNAKGKGILIL